MGHRSLLFIAFLCASAFLTGCPRLSPQQEHFQQAFKAYQKGDFPRALLYLKPLVEAGHPAGQLLLAKMYANGQGVPEDHGKAELLRNLAAYQIYSKGNLKPGEIRPANATLKSVSDRLDYYVGAQEGHEGKAPDLAGILDSLKSINPGEEQPVSGDPGTAMPNIEIDIPREVAEKAGASPDMPVSVAERQVSSVPGNRPNTRTVPQSGDSRRSEQITLGIVRQAAEQGDPQAMMLLSAAYVEGFYGVRPNATLARQWREKAQSAHGADAASSEEDALDKIPHRQLWTMIGVGLLFVLTGVSLWWRSR